MKSKVFYQVAGSKRKESLSSVLKRTIMFMEEDNNEASNAVNSLLSSNQEMEKNLKELKKENRLLKLKIKMLTIKLKIK